MAYQQQQVPCPPNAWTQISEYRPTRKSLIVQCPQVATSQAENFYIFTNVATVVAAANVLRKSLFASAVANYGGNLTTIAANANLNRCIFLNAPGDNGDGQQQSVMIDESWGQWPQLQWYGATSSAIVTGEFVILEEFYRCRAIILATAQNASVAGPFGTQPSGNWLSSDLSAGPANFRLQEPLDGEQTIQAWYAWPIGSVTVNITVSEAWTDNQPPPPPKTFRVDLPRLSTDAIAALNDLLGKMSQYDESRAENAA